MKLQIYKYSTYCNSIRNYHYYNEPGERPRSPSVETPVLDSDEEDDENENENEVPDLVYNFVANNEETDDDEEKEDDESMS
jgi:hypothetical protein